VKRKELALKRKQGKKKGGHVGVGNQTRPRVQVGLRVRRPPALGWKLKKEVMLSMEGKRSVTLIKQLHREINRGIEGLEQPHITNRKKREAYSKGKDVERGGRSKRVKEGA